MLRGPLGSVVNVTLARFSQGSNLTPPRRPTSRESPHMSFTIGVVRHRAHEFEGFPTSTPSVEFSGSIVVQAELRPDLSGLGPHPLAVLIQKNLL